MNRLIRLMGNHQRFNDNEQIYNINVYVEKFISDNEEVYR